MNSYRDLFDIPDDVCFLNTAYMGPMPIAAIDAGRAAALAKSQPWTISADDFFGPVEALRASVSKLFGASASGHRDHTFSVLWSGDGGPELISQGWSGRVGAR